MKPRSFILSYLIACTTIGLVGSYTSNGGQMSGFIGYQTYADLALNMGSMTSGATNVPIYDKDGNQISTLPLVPDLGAMLTPKNQIDPSENITMSGALVGSQGWISGASHCKNFDTTKGTEQKLSFGVKYGATKDTVFYESYRAVKTEYAGSTSSESNYSPIGDFSSARLGKLVTDAVAWDYCTDKSYLNNAAGLSGTYIIRIGGGNQTIVNNDGSLNTLITGPENALSAGTIILNPIQKPSEATVTLPDFNQIYGQPETSSDYIFYQYHFSQTNPKDTNPLPIGALSGDSGSAVIIYNQNTGKWEYLGCMITSDRNEEGNSNSFSVSGGPQWGTAVQDAYQTQINSDGTTHWVVQTDQFGNASLTDRDNASKSIKIDVLNSNRHGDTSTGIGKEVASNYTMSECKDWVFTGGGVDIVISGENRIDTGAGAIYFDRAGLETTRYSISQAEGCNITFNTAGYSIEKGVIVTSSLTGETGDEWRVVGRNGEGGMLEIIGTGNNEASLNIGVGAQAYLNRTDGYAVKDVKINTGAYVALGGSNQIGGDLIFGVQGGCLDLNGHHFERNANVHAFDKGALIANYTGEANYTFSGAGDHTYLGGFHDGKTAGQNGVLNVIYQGTTGDSWTLSGTSDISGKMEIQNGTVNISGYLTQHANDMVSGETVTNPNDWQTASFKSQEIVISDQASLVLNNKSTVSSKLDVKNKGTVNFKEGSTFSGNVSLAGHMIVEQGAVINANEIRVLAGSSISTIGGAVTLNNLYIDNNAQLAYDASLILGGNIVVQNASFTINNQVSLLNLNEGNAPISFTIDTRLGGNMIDSQGILTLNLDINQVNALISGGQEISSIFLEGLNLSENDTVCKIVLPDEYVFNSDLGNSNTLTASINQSNKYIQLNNVGVIPSIPEPSSGALGLLGLLGILLKRKRKEM